MQRRSSPALLGSAMWMYDLTGGLRIGKLPPADHEGRGARAHADAARAERRGRVHLLRRPDRRRPAHAHDRPHRRRPRRGGRELHRRHRARARTTTVACIGATVDADGETIDVRRPRRRERDRRVVRRRPRARRGHAPDIDPPGQGHPHHGAVDARCATTSRRSCRCRRTSGRSSSCRGATSPTSAPPTPTTTARSTIPQCTPDDVDVPARRDQRCVTTEPITEADIVGTWAGLRPLVAGGERARRTADLSRRHSVRTSDSGVITVTGGKLTTYRRMAADTVDAVGRRARSRRHAAAPSSCRCSAPRPARRRRRARPEHEHLAQPLRQRRRARCSTLERRRTGAGASRSCPGSPYLQGRGVYAVRARDGAHARRRALPPHPGPAARPRRVGRGRGRASPR